VITGGGWRGSVAGGVGPSDSDAASVSCDTIRDVILND